MSGLAGALTFVRRVDVQFDECIFALENWGLRPGSAGSIRVGRSRLSPAKSGEYPAKPGEGAPAIPGSPRSLRRGVRRAGEYPAKPGEGAPAIPGSPRSLLRGVGKSGEYPAKPGEGRVDGEHVLRSGRCKLSVLLYGGSLRPLPMELLLLPWSSLQGVIYLELVPRRAVRPSKR